MDKCNNITGEDTPCWRGRISNSRLTRGAGLNKSGVSSYLPKNKKPISRKEFLPKKRDNIAPVSKKQAEQNKKYGLLCNSFLRDNQECIAKIQGVCTHHATEVHHAKGRGKYLLVVKYFRAVCRGCHNWADAYPKEAINIGLSVSRHSIE